MTRIIAAVDNSAAAGPVIAAAVSLAPLFGATVEAVYVAEDDGQTAAASAAAFDVPFSVVRGDPLARLRALAAEDDVVTLAVGQRSRPGGRRRVGHLALALADVLDKPVLVVPPRAHASDRMQKVLIAVEGTPGKARELKRTVELTSAAGLELVVVHVDDEDSIPSFSDQVQHETESFTREFLARHLLGAPDARLELRIGVPADEILAAAAAVAPEMVALGWPHSAEAGRGSVAREVLDRSELPVLLVATR